MSNDGNALLPKDISESTVTLYVKVGGGKALLYKGISAQTYRMNDRFQNSPFYSKLCKN